MPEQLQPQNREKSASGFLSHLVENSRDRLFAAIMVAVAMWCGGCATSKSALAPIEKQIPCASAADKDPAVRLDAVEAKNCNNQKLLMASAVNDPSAEVRAAAVRKLKDSKALSKAYEAVGTLPPDKQDSVKKTINKLRKKAKVAAAKKTADLHEREATDQCFDEVKAVAAEGDEVKPEDFRAKVLKACGKVIGTPEPPTDAKPPNPVSDSHKSLEVSRDSDPLASIIPHPTVHPSYTEEDIKKIEIIDAWHRQNFLESFKQFRVALVKNQKYLGSTVKPVLLAKKGQLNGAGRKLLAAIEKILALDVPDSDLADIDSLQKTVRGIQVLFAQFPGTLMNEFWEGWDVFGKQEGVISHIVFEMNDFNIKTFNQLDFNMLTRHLDAVATGGYLRSVVTINSARFVFSGFQEKTK